MGGGNAVTKDMRVNPFERPLIEGRAPMRICYCLASGRFDEARLGSSYPGRAAYSLKNLTIPT